MTEPQTAEAHACAYCPEPGADVCVRMAPSASGPDRSVYAHEQCGRDRGLKPLYRLVEIVPAQEGPRVGAEHFG